MPYLFIFLFTLQPLTVTIAKWLQCFYNFEMFVWFPPASTPEEFTNEPPVHFIILINTSS